MKPDERQTDHADPEKLDERQDASVLEHGARQDNINTPAPHGMYARWNARVENLAGLEARGITRVLPEQRHAPADRSNYMHMFMLWFGMNLCALSVIPGLLGPLVFSLGWIDCVCIIIFANALSACGPAYMATFGAVSGNRTMVRLQCMLCLCSREQELTSSFASLYQILGRYFMGYWPSKLACLLNIVMQIGWAVIGAIVAGQMFSAANGAGLTVAAGCVVAALGIGIIATFGIGLVHTYER